MTDRSITHATFAIERVYPAAPARVFAAFADPQLKARWFAAPESFEQGTFALDFRVGGLEVNTGGPPGGPLYTYVATYAEIVPAERIVTSYTMDMDDTRISVSVATFEFAADGDGTRFVLTEHGAFLDGHDTPAAREHGSGELLDALGEDLLREAGQA